jgi:hypothetical protein
VFPSYSADSLPVWLHPKSQVFREQSTVVKMTSFLIMFRRQMKALLPDHVVAAEMVAARDIFGFMLGGHSSEEP